MKKKNEFVDKHLHPVLSIPGYYDNTSKKRYGADLYDLREIFLGKKQLKDIFADIPPANLFGFLRETDLFF